MNFIWIVLLFFISSLQLVNANESARVFVRSTDNVAKMPLGSKPNRIVINLNDNQIEDEITYTYSPITPPGTCDKDDCSADSDTNTPILIFDIVLDREKVSVGQMCTSIGEFKHKINGLHDLFCGPKFTLKWTAETYE